MIQEDDYTALEILYKKYSYLIYKKIGEISFKFDKDDFFQEGLIVLQRSIEKYKDGPVPFSAFFYKNLHNRFYSLSKASSKRTSYVFDNIVYLYDSSYNVTYFEGIKTKLFEGLTPLEIKLVELRIIRKEPLSSILKEYDLKRNTFYKILNHSIDKIKNNVSKYAVLFLD